MKQETKNIIQGVIGWLLVQLLILSIAKALWNIVMPSINVPEADFLQITAIYCLYKIFSYDWIEHFNKDLKKPK